MYGVIEEMIDRVKEKQPLIHNITNQVVMNFTANGLYAIGAAPVMANDIKEVADMTKNADGLLLNIGTLTSGQVEAMILAGKAANEKGIPVVFDPVGVGATPFRAEVAKRILEQVSVTLIRGNGLEMSHLAGLDVKMRGVDGAGEMVNESIARRAVEKLGVSVLVTGEQDVIADDNELIVLSNGSPLLSQVTGTGCLLSAVVTAFLAAGESTLVSATAAAAFYSIAAERAALKANLPGRFQVAFIDALADTTSQDLHVRMVMKHKKIGFEYE